MERSRDVRYYYFNVLLDASYLRLLPGNDNQISILSAKALGHLAICGASLTNEFVEFEVKRALEWLTVDRIESKRYAAVIILKELSKASPSAVHPFVPAFLDLIWNALKDVKVIIREGAAEALSACLFLVSQRESPSRKQW